MPFGPSQSSKNSVTLDTFGGIITAAKDCDIPEGGSPRNQDVDFLIGNVETRPGTVNAFNFETSSQGDPQIAISETPSVHPWINPGNILLNDGSYTTVLTISGTLSDKLEVTKFEFDITAGDQVVSLTVSLTGFCTDPTNEIIGQLVYNGSNIGSIRTFSLPSTPGITPFGTFDVLLTADIVNSPSFGIQLQSVGASSVISLSYVSLVANTSSGSVNFNYLTTGTYELNADDVQTLALDSDGNLYSDPDFSGILSQLSVSGVAPGSYGKSVSQDSREYICINNLQNGTYPPIQYVPNPNLTPNYWIDRVTQVGPGASPSFSNVPQSSSLAVGTQGAITAWSITSNVVTFTASNTFVAGQIVTISGLVTGAFLNGISFNVLGTGLSTGAFKVNFLHANDAGATEAGVATPQYSDAITSITQLPIQTSTYGPVNNSGEFTGVLWSAGPGSTEAGTTVTVYYWDAQQNPVGDTALIDSFNSGVPTYVYVNGTTIGIDGCWQVTSVGTGKGPGGQDNQYFFTYQMPTSNYQIAGFSNGPALGEYQQTVATLTLVLPDPGLDVGTQVTISGVTGGAWNNEFTITGALNSGAYAITGTQMASGIATYNYADAPGTTVPPAVGQLVTITNTLNGNGVFNVADATISAVDVGAGTFSVAGFSIQTISFDAENGQATTAGTQFTIDPGTAVAGSNPATSPIYGNGTGGSLTVLGGTAQQIGSGTRQGAVMFLTRNGAITAPSAPVTFTIPENSNYIYVTSIPIGPPNVVGRIVTLTEAGSNGVAGGSFYYIPTPVQFTVNGVVFTSSSFVINDNITSSAAFTFTDQVLLAATEIDVQGNNLFNQIELGDPAWDVSYAGRLMFGGCQSKIQNFTNLSFDGGYLNSSGTTNLLPLGWNISAAYNPATGSFFTITGYAIASGIVTFDAVNTLQVGQDVYVQGISVVTALNNLIYVVISTNGTTFTAATVNSDVSQTFDSGQAIPINAGITLNQSAIFGNSLFIGNTTGVIQSVLAMLYQGAYQDAYQVPIIEPQTLYSVRITARSTISAVGALVIDLTSLTAKGVSTSTSGQFGQTYGSATWSFATMGTAFTTQTFPLLTTAFGDETNGVPTDLVLRLYAQNIPNGTDVEIDSIEIFPTQAPVDATKVYSSYIDDPEGIDGVTGILDLSLNNAESTNGAAVLYDLLYFLKDNSIFVTQDSPGSEPSQWDLKQVAARAGTVGPNSYDIGENYILTACRSGIYVFTGNQPMKVNWEVQAIWEAINWSAGRSIWIVNDTTARRFYVGIPLPTPNYWLPGAPVNSAPSFPNVILMCNYQAIESGPALEQATGINVTMFGTLKSNDMRRKWTLWNIASPYGALLTQSDGATQTMSFGNGIGSSQILQLNSSATSDAGAPINSRYTTYGFVDTAKAKENPLLGLHQKRYTYLQSLATGAGNCAVTLYPNSTTNPTTYSIPGGLNLDANPDGTEDFEKPLNVRCQRVFVEYATVGDNFSLSKMILVGSKDTLPIRGNIM